MKVDLTNQLNKKIKKLKYSKIMEIQNEMSDREKQFNTTTLSLLRDLVKFKTMLIKNVDEIRKNGFEEEYDDLEKMVNFLS